MKQNRTEKWRGIEKGDDYRDLRGSNFNDME